MAQQEALTMTERLDKAKILLESSADEAIPLLRELQVLVAQASLFSKNEGLDDIATKSIPFLCLEHYLAMGLIQSTTRQPDVRLANLRASCDLFDSFLHSIEGVELLQESDKKDLEKLVDLNANGDERTLMMPFDRDTKIARLKAKQSAEQTRNRLLASQQRRQRLGVAETDEMDGHDEESLLRDVHIQTIQICVSEALEEWASVLREIPMLSRMVDSERDRERQKRHQGGSQTEGSADHPTQLRPSGPLKLTHITKDATSGQLQIRKEEIRSQVFQPGWNQPTMSLEELAEHEIRDAMQREERQKEAEAANARAPRRYDQIVKDGLEDDKELVDASAALDQQWDDWKDENPRGSGNKRGDVGDRNF